MHKKVRSLLLTSMMCCAMVAVHSESITPLSDNQLSDVCAQGFNVTIDVGVDLAASDPDSLVIVKQQLDDALQSINKSSTTRTVDAGSLSRLPASIDSSGNVVPGGISTVTNSLTLSDNALQNAQSLLTVFALNGDVAVGMNLNVIVNPGDTPFTVTQINMNWANLLLSDATQTPAGQ